MAPQWKHRKSLFGSQALSPRGALPFSPFLSSWRHNDYFGEVIDRSLKPQSFTQPYSISIWCLTFSSGLLHSSIFISKSTMHTQFTLALICADKLADWKRDEKGITEYGGGLSHRHLSLYATTIQRFAISPSSLMKLNFFVTRDRLLLIILLLTSILFFYQAHFTSNLSTSLEPINLCQGQDTENCPRPLRDFPSKYRVII